MRVESRDFGVITAQLPVPPEPSAAGRAFHAVLSALAGEGEADPAREGREDRRGAISADGPSGGGDPAPDTADETADEETPAPSAEDTGEPAVVPQRPDGVGDEIAEPADTVAAFGFLVIGKLAGNLAEKLGRALDEVPGVNAKPAVGEMVEEPASPLPVAFAHPDGHAEVRDPIGAAFVVSRPGRAGRAETAFEFAWPRR